MKKIFAHLLVALLLVVFASPVVAQSEVSEEVLQTRASKYEEVFNRAYSKASEKLRNYEAFISKLESRRAKLAEEGADVEDLDGAIRLAKSEFGDARGAVNTAKTNLEELDLTQDVRTIRSEARSEIRTIRNEFKELNQSLSKAVRIAKQLSN